MRPAPVQTQGSTIVHTGSAYRVRVGGGEVTVVLSPV